MYTQRKLTKKIKKEVYDYFGGICQLCMEPVPEELTGTSKPDAPVVDHIVPIAWGGTDEFRNLQLAHRRCNLKKGTNLNYNL